MVELAEYRELRSNVIAQGYGAEIAWIQDLKTPATAEALFAEYTWVVVNSGMKNQVAEQICDRIHAAIAAGRPVSSAFGHAGKSAAIQTAWDQRSTRFAEFQTAQAAGIGEVFAWLDSLPWIGPTTRFHLAKNIGVNCAKPDRWLQRVAEAAGESVDELCARLAADSGDRIATVDLVIWRACNLGLWHQIID